MNTNAPETSADTSSDIPDTVAAINTPCLLSLTTLTAAAVKNLELALISATIEGLKVTTLLDSGASDEYLSAKIAQRLCLELAFDSASTVSDGFVTSTTKLAGREYSLAFMVVKELCTDGIRGQRFMKRHRNVVFATGGLENDFVLGDSSACRVAASKTPTPRLFRNLQPSVKPEATKSRQFNTDDQAFI